MHAVVQPLGNLLGYQDVDARRRQLNGKGHAIEPLADLRHEFGVLCVDGKGRSNCARTLIKEAHSLRLHQLCHAVRGGGMGAIGRWHTQHRYLPHLFTLDR
jgi:hypothetical protein